MNKKTFSPYNKTMSLLAICFCLVLTFVLLCPSMQVFADYSDLNENTLVNFNQLINITGYSADNSSHISSVNNCSFKINSTLSNGATALFTQNTLIAGHQYYMFGNNNQAFRPVDTNGNTFGDSIPLIYQPSSNRTLYYLNYNSIYGNYNIGDVVSYNIIDLTQMFGTGNEPNLQQCKDYFTAQYYSYTTGTQIPFSKSYLQGYQEGAQSVYESLTITYNSYTIGANSQTYANNTIERGTLEFDQQYSAYAFSGVIAINLLGEVQRGTNITIDFELTIPDLQGESSTYAETFTLYFAYVDSNNNLVNITGINAHYIGGWDNQYRGDFVMPITTSTLYCYLDYNTIGDNFGPTQAIAFKSDITFVGLDVAQLVNNAYYKGASDTNAKYSYGGVLYQSIYDLGKAEGIAEGNSYATGLDVIATTFTQVFSIFNIEILPGIPLTIFILLPLLFGLIMFVVKMTKGE